MKKLTQLSSTIILALIILTLTFGTLGNASPTTSPLKQDHNNETISHTQTSSGVWSGTLTATTDITITAGVTITIQPNTTILISTTDTLHQGNDPNKIEFIIKGDGQLKINGPVTFTSMAPTPTPAHWHGIVFEPNSDGFIDDVIIEYAVHALTLNTTNTITVANSTIRYNKHTSTSGPAFGAGIAIITGSHLITNTKIYSNNVIGTGNNINAFGAGIDIQGGRADIINSYIAYNSVSATDFAIGAGGGISIRSNKNTSLIKNNQIISNTLISSNFKGYGAGIGIDGTTLTTISNNFIAYNVNLSNFATGGAVGLENGAELAIIASNVFYNNTVKANTQSKGGGIGALQNNNLLIQNNLIVNNLALIEGFCGGECIWGGGIYLGSSTKPITLYNNTIVNNITRDDITGQDIGGGIYVNADTEVINNIVFSNTASTAPNSNITLNNTNMSTNPQFIATGPLTQYYHLSHNSPAIDQAQPIINLIQDFDGDPRPLGPAPDIGFDEVKPIILTKTATPSSPSPGNILTYTITLSNPDTYAFLNNATLIDAIPANTTYQPGTLTCNIPGCIDSINLITWTGDLTPGLALTIQYTVTLNTIFTNTHTITNQANLSLNNTPSITAQILTPINGVDLILSKTSYQSTITPGLPITYTITITNHSNQTATVTLTDTLPPYINTVSASHNGQHTLITATWTFTLNPNQTTTRIITLTSNTTFPPAIEVMTNTATVTATQTDLNPLNNTAIITTPLNASPDLEALKIVNKPVITPGQILTYTITISNNGTQDATNVIITDTLPQSTTLLFTDCGLTTTTTITKYFPIFTATTQYTCTVSVRLSSGVPANMNRITNTITITDDVTNGPDTTPTNNTRIAFSTVQAHSDIQITKIAHTNIISPGQLLTYAITITNIGKKGTKFVLTDVLPISTTFISANDGGDETFPGSRIVVWDDSNRELPAGKSFQTQITVIVSPTVPNNLITLTNTAIVQYNDAMSITNGFEHTTLQANANLILTKTSPLTQANAGQILPYIITITNIGNRETENIILTDTLPADTIFYGASHGGIQTITGTVVWSSSLPNINGGGGTLPVTVAVKVKNVVTTNSFTITNMATATAKGSPVATTTYATEVIASPDLTLIKRTTEPIASPNKLLTYTITITNIGNRTASQIHLTDTLPLSTTFISASHGGQEVAPPGSGIITWTHPFTIPGGGQTRTLTLTVRPGTSFLEGVEVLTNIATVSDDYGPDPTLDDNIFTHTIELDAGPDLRITKTSDGLAVPGEVLRYTLYATNLGFQVATNVVVTDVLDANTQYYFSFCAKLVPTITTTQVLTWPIPILPISNTPLECEIIVEIQEPVPAGLEQIRNTAIITDYQQNGPDSNTNNNEVARYNTVIAQPQFSITKDNGTNTVSPSDILTYTITLTNTGNQGATGIVITDTIPTGTTFINAIPTYTRILSGNIIAWDITTELNGDKHPDGNTLQRTIVISLPHVVPANLHFITNTVFAHDDGTNSNTPGNIIEGIGDDSDEVIAYSQFTITKTNNTKVITPGNTLTYTITITNIGNREATNLTITDTLPQYIQSAHSPDGGLLTNNKIVWTEPNLWGGGCQVTCTLTRTVIVTFNNTIPITITHLTNTVAISADNALTTVITSDTDIVTGSPEIIITKTDNKLIAQPGDRLTYTINITNSGNRGTYPLTLTDILPQSTNFVQALPQPIATLPNTITWYVSPLSGGETTTYTLVVTLDDSVPFNLYTITNTAILTDGINTAIDITKINATANLTITKTATPSAIQPGQPLTYTITITNQGNREAQNIIISDTIPTHTNFVTATYPFSKPNNTITWSLNSLHGANTTQKYTLTVSLTNPIPHHLNWITNTVQVLTNSTPITTYILTTPITNAAPNLVITKTNYTTTVSPGDILTYTITITNKGNKGITNFQVTDILPADTIFIDSDGGTVISDTTATTVTWIIPTLAGGNASTTRNITLQVGLILPASVNFITNTALAQYNINTQPIITTATDIDLIDAQAILTITKTNNTNTVSPNDILTYTIIITNSGDRIAPNLVISDTIPQHTILHSYSNDLITQSGHLISAQPFNLNPFGATKTYTISVKANTWFPANLQAITNTVTLLDDTGPIASSTHTDTIPLTITPTLTLIKTNHQDIVEPSDRLTYTITITNSGGREATNLTLTDILPLHTNFITASQNISPTNNTLTWTINSLAGGEATISYTVVVSVIASVPITATQLTNTVTLANQANIITTTTDIDPINATANLTITKTATPSTIQPGDLLTYTITITNTGNREAQNIIISDTIPTHTNFITAIPAYSQTGNIITWSLDSLHGANTTQKYTLIVSLTNPIPHNLTTITNTAHVLTNSTPITNATITTPITNAFPILRITKTDDLTQTTPGRVLTYTITITNSGNQNSGNIILTDTLPTHTTLKNRGDGTFTSPNKIIWFIDNIEGGYTSLTKTLSLTVNNIISANTHYITNTALAQYHTISQSITIQATDEDLINAQAQLTITKTNYTDTVSPNDILTYTITITNNGNRVAPNLIISDTIHPNTKFIAHSPNLTTQTNRLITSQPFTLSGLGDHATYTITVQADSYFPANLQAITNTVNLLTNTLPITSATDIDLISDAVTYTLTLTKTDHKTIVQPGERLTYTIILTNTGGREATDLILTDILPLYTNFISATPSVTPTAGIITWPTFNLAGAGKALTYTVIVSVNASVPINATELTNTATLANQTDIITTVTDADLISATANLTITKSNNYTQVTPGQTLTYTIIVTNIGNREHPTTNLIDTLSDYTTFQSASTPGSETSPGSGIVIWTLPPLDGNKDSITHTLTVIVDEIMPSNILSITNLASVDSKLAYHTDDLLASPTLIISKTDNITQTVPGDILTYLITITNIGNQEAAGLILTDTLPFDVTFISTSNNCTPTATNNGIIVWSLPNLWGSGQVLTCTLTASVNPAIAATTTHLTNTVTIADDSGLTATNTDVDLITASAALTITKTTPYTFISPAKPITYTITITNIGNRQALNLIISDTIPTHMHFISSIPPITPTTNIVTWSLDSLAGNHASQQYVLVLGLNIPVPQNLTTITNTAQVLTNGIPLATDSVTTSITNANAHLIITKTNNITIASPDDILTYTIQVTNIGYQQATNLILTDTIPAHTTLLNPLSNSTTILSTSHVIWHIPTLSVQETITHNLTIQLNNPMPLNLNTITNTATVIANGLPPITAHDIDTLNATLTFSLTKTTPYTIIQPGDTITYTITVTNWGNQTATNLQLLDNPPEYITAIIPSHTGTTSVGGNVYWLLPDLQSGGTSLTRLVTITLDTDIPLSVDKITNNISLFHPEISTNKQAWVTTLITRSFALTISKTTPDTIMPGSLLTYTIIITNKGKSPLTGITITDTVTAPFTVNTGSLYLPPTGTSNILTTSTPITNNSPITQNMTLLAGESVTFFYVIYVPINAPQDTPIINTVSATANQLPQPTTAQAISSIYDLSIKMYLPFIVKLLPPNLRISKNGPAFISLGQLITYTITVENLNHSVETVDIYDKLPSGSQFFRATNGGVELNNNIVWLDKDISSGSNLQNFKFSVIAQNDIITNDNYYINARDGYVFNGTPSIQTKACNAEFPDDFSNPNSGWLVGTFPVANYNYVSPEVYQIHAKSSLPFSASPYGSYSDYALSVDVHWNGNVLGNEYGLIFGIQNKLSQEVLFADYLYRFVVDTKGSTRALSLRAYNPSYYQDYNWHPIVDWLEYNDIIFPDNETNTLEVNCHNSSVSIYVNEYPIPELNNLNLPFSCQGEVGFSSHFETATTPASETDAQFDNFRVCGIATSLLESNQNTTRIPIDNSMPPD